jgi:hypothetical protein
MAVADAAQLVDRDICIHAHIYDVVELADGTRFLDVCPPETVDEDCQFLIVSRNDDRDVVGELAKYRDHDVNLRGVVRPMHGRMGIVLSHMRQFSGGPEKFRPDPRLVRGFNGQADRMPVHDPNLRAVRGRRGFMNTRDRETVPLAKP